MNPKDTNNSPSLNGPIDWKSLGFFSGDDYLVYVFKKTEKITAALYLISGLLKDDEPMKWELRDRGIDMLTSSFTASSSLPGDKNAVIQALFTAALETLSLLNVARISNLISEMNHTLLTNEVDKVVSLLRDRLAASAENAGYVLSEHFFKTSENPATNTRPSVKLEIKPENKEKKSQRQENILSVLKGQSNITIKDISRVIKDCSEKTIQRELSELVDKGVIKKEGERRWSRYSLK